MGRRKTARSDATNEEEEQVVGAEPTLNLDAAAATCCHEPITEDERNAIYDAGWAEGFDDALRRVLRLIDCNSDIILRDLCRSINKLWQRR
jgi:hypothetical protein